MKKKLLISFILIVGLKVYGNEFRSLDFLISMISQYHYMQPDKAEIISKLKNSLIEKFDLEWNKDKHYVDLTKFYVDLAKFEGIVVDKLIEYQIGIDFEMYLCDLLLTILDDSDSFVISVDWAKSKYPIYDFYFYRDSLKLTKVKNIMHPDCLESGTIQNNDEVISINSKPIKFLTNGLFYRERTINDSLHIILRQPQSNETYHYKALGETKVFDLDSLNFYEYQLYSDSILYLKINSLTKSKISKEIESKIKKDVPKIKKIIIDVRGCKGGYLDEIVYFVDLFLEKGLKIVELESKLESSNKIRYSKRKPILKPESLLILVNHRTNSGANIIAGSLTSYGLGLTIGETTSFENSIFRPILLPNRDYIAKFKTAEYKIGKNSETFKHGIVPNLFMLDCLFGENDKILEKALVH